MRVVLDTNVLIAAFAARGLCADVFEVCLEGHTVVTSEHILSETKENLTHKLHLPMRTVQEIIAYLRDIAEVVKPKALDTPVCRDKSDDPVIGTALNGGATLIITGDRDLLTLKEYGGIKVVTPREFWNYLRR